VRVPLSVEESLRSLSGGIDWYLSLAQNIHET